MAEWYDLALIFVLNRHDKYVSIAVHLGQLSFAGGVSRRRVGIVADIVADDAKPSVTLVCGDEIW